MNRPATRSLAEVVLATDEAFLLSCGNSHPEAAPHGDPRGGPVTLIDVGVDRGVWAVASQDVVPTTPDAVDIVITALGGGLRALLYGTARVAHREGVDPDHWSRLLRHWLPDGADPTGLRLVALDITHGVLWDAQMRRHRLADLPAPEIR